MWLGLWSPSWRERSMYQLGNERHYVGPILSGALLTSACNTVEDADCAFVLPAVLVSWGLFGGICAAMSGSGMRPVNPNQLAPYARFPQGLPGGCVPER